MPDNKCTYKISRLRRAAALERGVGRKLAAETPRPGGVVSSPREDIGRGGGVQIFLGGLQNDARVTKRPHRRTRNRRTTSSADERERGPTGRNNRASSNITSTVLVQNGPLV